MDKYENSIIKGIHISRYVASWLDASRYIEKAERRTNNNRMLINWLRSLTINGEQLTEDEIWRIYYFATDGKLELESSAKQFIKRKGS